MKQLEVQIMGQSYLLGCPEGGDSRLLDAVERVDTAMCKIRDSGKIRARDRIAVLAALNLAFDLADNTPTNQVATEPVAALQEALLPTATELTDGGDVLLQSLLERLNTALDVDGRPI